VLRCVIGPIPKRKRQKDYGVDEQLTRISVEPLFVRSVRLEVVAECRKLLVLKCEAMNTMSEVVTNATDDLALFEL